MILEKQQKTLIDFFKGTKEAKQEAKKTIEQITLNDYLLGHRLIDDFYVVTRKDGTIERYCKKEFDNLFSKYKLIHSVCLNELN